MLSRWLSESLGHNAPGADGRCVEVRLIGPRSEAGSYQQREANCAELRMSLAQAVAWILREFSMAGRLGRPWGATLASVRTSPGDAAVL